MKLADIFGTKYGNVPKTKLMNWKQTVVETSIMA
jgi:hypothetical protein